MKDSLEERQRRAEELRPLVEKQVPAAGSERQAARQIGVSNTALSRFLAGEVPYGPTLDKYAAWLKRGVTSDNGTTDAVVDENAALEMPEVWKRLDEIGRTPGITEAARLMRIEQVLAAGRMALQHKEARAAEARTRAIEREAGAAEIRTQMASHADAAEATPSISAEELARRAQSAHPPIAREKEEEDGGSRAADGA